MFEITGDDIAALNDVDLRSLIGLLCEAELRRSGLTVSAVTWGGNQTAKDAGLDVRVALPASTAIDGFIPRPATGFQVKKSDMPRSSILDEMKLGGVVRPSILDLANASGAYIIVSAAGSTSDSALTARRDAMAEAMQGVPNGDKLSLDFFDRNRVATWVRDHAGLIPWVRARIGRSIPGWRPYGGWSHIPDGVDGDYLLDDAARIKTGSKDEGDGFSAVDGINRIREILQLPGQVVRLVGLSGVGKTRLVEALFDEKIGNNSLDPALAFYTNVAEGPDPQPPGLASDLLAARTRAILVIDNCPSELHHQLSEIVRVAGTTISVVTVEYDIREDQPEGADVFSLEPSSIELIEKLVAKRFPDLSQVDARTIADFSGGNARVAIALAGTVKKSETIAGLSDAELFRRLFQQRQEPDESLLLIAQACSLVYSFQGCDLSGDNAELPIIGSLIGKSAEEIFRGVAKLRSRDLLQERGVWRAVLPHAIANRLAVMALQSIPYQTLDTVIVKDSSERLRRSFSRRLGYLDGSKEARAIVERWLSPGGLLDDVANFNELGKDMFNNVAPVMPEAALSVLGRNLKDADAETFAKCKHFVRLLRSLAYEPALFERATTLLTKFAEAEGESESNSDGDASKVVASLCYIYLSGTHATVEQRLRLIDGLLRSPKLGLQGLGASALEAMLETDHFSSSYLFEFGARSRDHGYHPKTGKDIAHWYGSALKFAESFATSEHPAASYVRAAIASSFRGLWGNVARYDDLERISREIAAKDFWREGWIAARQTRIYGSKELSSEALARLSALEEFLRPKDLVNKVRGIVLETKGIGIDFDDDIVEHTPSGYAAAAARLATAIENLGHDVAADESAFKVLLPELVRGGGKLGPFGHALGSGAANPRELWDALVQQMAVTPSSNPHVLSGFLHGVQKVNVLEADALLDEAIDDPTLAAWFPYLQASVVIDDKGVARLQRALELGKAPIDRFDALAYGRACDPISGPSFRDLALAIAKKPGGHPVALHMVSMRLHADSMDNHKPLPETIETGRALLNAYQLGGRDSRATREDYELGVIVKVCLASNDGAPVVQHLCSTLKDAAARRDIRAYNYGNLVRALFDVHPETMLDGLFVGDEKSVSVGVSVVETLVRFRKHPLDGVSDEKFLAWCDHDPATRYPLAAAVGNLFKQSGDNDASEWTNLASALLKKAPDPQAVLNQIIRRLYPNSWSGSWATKMESHAKLLDQLDVGSKPEMAKAIAEARGRMREQIDTARRKENEEDKERSGKFE